MTSVNVATLRQYVPTSKNSCVICNWSSQHPDAGEWSIRNRVLRHGLNGLTSTHGRDLDGRSRVATTTFGSNFGVTMNAGTKNAGSIFNLVLRGMGINSNGSNDASLIDSFLPSVVTPDGAGPANLDATPQPISEIPEGLELSFATTIPATINVLAFDFQAIDGTGQADEDALIIDFAGGISHNVNGSNVDFNDQYLVNQQVNQGGVISINFAGGDGFRLEGILLDVNPASVPEGSSFAMFLLSVGIVTRIR